MLTFPKKVNIYNFVIYDDRQKRILAARRLEMRVLLVEDDYAVSQSIETMLKKKE